MHTIQLHYKQINTNMHEYAAPDMEFRSENQRRLHARQF